MYRFRTWNRSNGNVKLGQASQLMLNAPLTLIVKWSALNAIASATPISVIALES